MLWFVVALFGHAVISVSLSESSGAQDKYRKRDIRLHLRKGSESSSSDSWSSSSSSDAKNGFSGHQTKPLRKRDIIPRHKFPQDGSTIADIAIVGMGPGGSVQLNRWARTFPDLDVVMLENGRDDVREPNATTCEIVDNVVQPGCRDWGVDARAYIYPNDPNKCMGLMYEVFSSPEDAMATTPANGLRGSTWGGTSTLNLQIYLRGTKVGTWDRVEKAVESDEWSFENMVESFKRIENRRQKTIDQAPFFYLPPTVQEVDGYNIFDPSYPAYSGNWFSEQYFSTLENEIPIQTPTSLSVDQQAFIKAAIETFPGRFANEFFNRTEREYSIGSEFPEVDEGFMSAPSSVVDQSAALLRYQFLAMNLPDVFGPALPNAFKYFQYSKDTPGPAAYLAKLLNMPDDFTQLAVPAYMDILGPFGTLNRADGILLPSYPPSPVPAFPGAVLAAINIARSNAAASFVNVLVNRSFVPTQPRSNVHIKSSVRVDRLIFADELWPGEGDPTRVVGIEYLDDAWDANRIGRTFYTNQCNQTTAKNAADNALQQARKKVYVTHEVIISAGTMDTPAILQRSGIGRPSHLESLQTPIKTRVKLPGVGYNVRNHADIFMLWTQNVSADVVSPLSPTGGLFQILRSRSTRATHSDMNSIMKTRINLALLQDTNSSWRSLFANTTSWTSPITSDPRRYPSAQLPRWLNQETGGMLIEQQVSTTTGSMLIESPDPTVPVRLFENLLGDDRDVEAYVDHIADTVLPLTETLKTTHTRRVDYCVNSIDNSPHVCSADPSVRDVSVQQTFPNDGGAHFVEWLWPARDELYSMTLDMDDPSDLFGNPTPVERPDRKKIREFVQKNRFQGWHEVGSCAMGPAHREEAVLDAHGRVYNVRGLRVADASIFPVIPDVNVQGPTYGASQRLFELACKEYTTTLGHSAALDCKPSTQGPPLDAKKKRSNNVNTLHIDKAALAHMMADMEHIAPLRLAMAMNDFSLGQ